MLDHKIALYVPLFRLKGERDDARFIASLFWKWFGGATVVEGRGFWGKEVLLEEDVAVVYSFCTLDQLIESLQKVKGAAWRLGKELGQESVALEVDNVMELVEMGSSM